MRFLVVDDDCASGTWLASELTARSMPAETSRSGDALCLALRAAHYDGIVLNCLPADNGGPCPIRELRLMEPGVPILVIGARCSQDDCIRALDSGADDYLGRPCSMPELIARLRAVARRPSIGRSSAASYGVEQLPPAVEQLPEAFGLDRAERYSRPEY